MLRLTFIAASAGCSLVSALPARGWNSWFAFDVHTNETNTRTNSDALVSTGLTAAGFTLVALDGGWQARTRDAQGNVAANATAFPSGLLSLSRHLLRNGQSFGIYTDRGGSTCDGHVGSAGHEAQDAAFYASVEASYLKSDSCAATQSHAGALAQYATMQAALNATGRPFVFSLCGWLQWYSGAASQAGVGTSWRIGPDALGWPNVLMNMDAAANGAKFVRHGAYLDVDEIMGPSRGRPINPVRTLTQFAFIATVASPLLLSFDLTGRTAADPDVAPFLNEEVLAVHWDAAPPAFSRAVGGALAPDRVTPLTGVPCGDAAAGWDFSPLAPGGSTGTFASRAAPGLCLMAGAAWFAECQNAQQVWLGACGVAGEGPNCCASSSTPGNCTNQHFALQANGTITTPYWPGNNNAAGNIMTRDAPTPNGVFFEEALQGADAARQAWAWDAAAGTLASAYDGKCLGAAPRDTTNVWVRQLSGGDAALLFINNGAAPQTLTCGAACCEAAGLARDAVVRVRDLFARTDNGTAGCAAGIAFEVPPGGASVFVRVAAA